MDITRFGLIRDIRKPHCKPTNQWVDKTVAIFIKPDLSMFIKKPLELKTVELLDCVVFRNYEDERGDDAMAW